MVRKRTYCVDCHQLVLGNPNDSCKRFPWLISLKLVKADKVCSYDSFKDEFFDEPRPDDKDNLKAWKTNA